MHVSLRKSKQVHWAEKLVQKCNGKARSKDRLGPECGRH